MAVSEADTAMAIAEACADLGAGTVRFINLSRKKVRAEDAQALAVALQENDSLTALYLNVCMLH